MVRPHQGSLSGEAWFRAHVCVAADEAGKKGNRTRARAGWQILDLLKAGYTFERDLGLNCLLLSQCISYRRKMRTGRAGAGCQNLDLLKPGHSFGRDSSFWTSI